MYVLLWVQNSSKPLIATVACTSQFHPTRTLDCLSLPLMLLITFPATTRCTYDGDPESPPRPVPPRDIRCIYDPTPVKLTWPATFYQHQVARPNREWDSCRSSAFERPEPKIRFFTFETIVVLVQNVSHLNIQDVIRRCFPRKFDQPVDVVLPTVYSAPQDSSETSASAP